MTATEPSSLRATLDASDLTTFVARLFTASHLEPRAADLTSRALVAADLDGLASHGVVLAPLYLQRIAAGSVSLRSSGEIVGDFGAVVVIDGCHALGQVTAEQAVSLASARASSNGLAAVAVRRAFHFGAAGYWARMLAEKGAIGFVSCNTRPLMPAVGGAEPVVGNNPIAIAAPTSAEPVALDMALSAGAMGKIRLAAASGQSIPENWAADAAGVPTRDPLQAIKGMLLPAGGAKGFGLAFMADLLCGALANGGAGNSVSGLYDDLSQPYNCSHFFMAFQVDAFRPLEAFKEEASRLCNSVRGSRRAPGVDALYAPGDRRIARRAGANGQCAIALPTVRELCACADRLDVAPPPAFARILPE